MTDQETMPPADDARLVSLQVGRIAPLGSAGVPSGFVKHPVSAALHVGPLNIAGDEQADLRVHGGPDKAVYAYAAAHYPAWARDYPEHRDRLSFGVFGENLTVDGLTEDAICAGDVHRIGSVTLQVCQPRQPCFKFALRFDDRRMPNAMIRNGRSGWYYRVLDQGQLQAGDTLRLIDRPHGDVPLNDLIALAYRQPLDKDALERIAGASAVVDWMRDLAARMVKSR